MRKSKRGGNISMKKLMMVLLALTLVISLAACGSSENNTTNNSGTSSNTGDSSSNANNSGDDAAEPEPVTLRMAWWGGQPRHDYTLEVIAMYEEQNPHVTIEPEYAGWPDYWQKLAPQAAANELPDILQMDLSYLAQYGERNQLADLTPFLGEEIDVTNIPDSVISGGNLGDKTFGFNLGVNALGFQYDPALLKQAGVDSLDEDWTWDDYTDIAMKAKDAGLYMDTGLQGDVFFNYFLRTQGKSLYNAEGTAIGYEDDQLFIDHFSRMVELVKAGAVPTPDIRAESAGNIELSPAVLGEAIGIFQWSNQFVGYQQVVGEDRPLEMHNTPGPGMEKGLFLKPSMFFSISENSAKKEEAAKFINFFVNDVEANKIIKGDRGVPGSSVVKDALKPLLSESEVKVFDYIAWAQDNSSPLGAPDPIGTGEVIALLDSLIERMDYEDMAVEDAAKEFRTEANNILSANK
jgi:multiple sugar transport system substrate-binding protein